MASTFWYIPRSRLRHCRSGLASWRIRLDSESVDNTRSTDDWTFCVIRHARKLTLTGARRRSNHEAYNPPITPTLNSSWQGLTSEEISAALARVEAQEGGDNKLWAEVVASQYPPPTPGGTQRRVWYLFPALVNNIVGILPSDEQAWLIAAFGA